MGFEVTHHTTPKAPQPMGRSGCTSVGMACVWQQGAAAARMAPCGALCVPPCISDMDTLMETRECRAGPLTAAIQPRRGEPSPQTHHHHTPTPRPITSPLPVDTRRYHRLLLYYSCSNGYAGITKHTKRSNTHSPAKSTSYLSRLIKFSVVNDFGPLPRTQLSLDKG